MQTTCEDVARFGYLFLNRGRWVDDQVVPRSWVRAAVGRPSQSHNAAYGFLWWLNRHGPVLGALETDAPGQPPAPVGRAIPGAAGNVFTAQGLGGQVLLVDPDSRTVVVRLGQLGGGTYTARDAARFVTEALVRQSATSSR
jgi:CubicO group peptidase (beta-lactamase class C family)